MDNKRKSKTNQKYTNENYDSLSIYVPKGRREILKKYASEHGMSLNKLITSALEEYFDKHGSHKKASGKFIPWQVVTISIDGKILD